MSASSHPSANCIEILLVEDDDDDVRLAKKALERAGVHHRMHRVEDGVEAMEFLRQEGEFSDSVRADLILLDLNLPRKSGREVLKEIHEDALLQCIPVIVLSTSDDERDIAECCNLQVKKFVTKPSELEGFREVIDFLKNFRRDSFF